MQIAGRRRSDAAAVICHRRRTVGEVAAPLDMTTANKRLLLWDTGATVITSARGGGQSLRRAVQQRFGLESDLRDIESACPTDRRTGGSILRKYEIETTEEKVGELL